LDSTDDADWGMGAAAAAAAVSPVYRLPDQSI